MMHCVRGYMFIKQHFFHTNIYIYIYINYIYAADINSRIQSLHDAKGYFCCVANPYSLLYLIWQPPMVYCIQNTLVITNLMLY